LLKEEVLATKEISQKSFRGAPTWNLPASLWGRKKHISRKTKKGGKKKKDLFVANEKKKKRVLSNLDLRRQKVLIAGGSTMGKRKRLS